MTMVLYNLHSVDLHMWIWLYSTLRDICDCTCMTRCLWQHTARPAEKGMT